MTKKNRAEWMIKMSPPPPHTPQMLKIKLRNGLIFDFLSFMGLYSELHTGSCSTLKFPSRVNFSVPSLYCIARTLGKLSRHSIGLAGATRLTQSDFRLNLLLLKGQRCVYRLPYIFMCWLFGIAKKVGHNLSSEIL